MGLKPLTYAFSLVTRRLAALQVLPLLYYAELTKRHLSILQFFSYFYTYSPANILPWASGNTTSYCVPLDQTKDTLMLLLLKICGPLMLRLLANNACTATFCDFYSFCGFAMLLLFLLLCAYTYDFHNK